MVHKLHIPLLVVTGFISIRYIITIVSEALTVFLPEKWQIGRLLGMIRNDYLEKGNMARKLVWLVVSTPLKNISQLGWLFPIYGKIKRCSKPPTSMYSFGTSPFLPGFPIDNCGPWLPVRGCRRVTYQGFFHWKCLVFSSRMAISVRRLENGTIWRFPWPWGYPQMDEFIEFYRENPVKMDDVGVPLF